MSGVRERIILRTLMLRLIGALVIFFAASGVGNAATVTYFPGTETVIAIGGLDIGGALYNVDFAANWNIDGSEDYITYGGTVDFWEGDAAGASLAVDAIVDVMNSLSENALVGVLDSPDFFTVMYDTTYDPDGAAVAGYSAGAGGPWLSAGEFARPSSAEAGAFSHVVPVPAAAWLFGSALLGLGVFKRKRA